MKNFEDPKMELVLFGVQDVMTTSITEDEDEGETMPV